MSGSSVPAPPSVPPAPAPTPARSDLATEVDKTIHLFCEKGEQAAELLPFKLSEAAGKEVRRFCADVTQRADRYTGDLQAVVLERWDLVSDDTKKELAELAKKAASPYRALPENGTEMIMPDVGDFTSGKGKQYKLGVPVKFASHTDVKLLVNFDFGNITRLQPKFLGIGAEVAQPFSWGDLRGSVFVDTSRGVPDYAGFIKLNINLP